MDAARLVVHLSAFSNEDGWKLVSNPAEFLAIEFNIQLAPAVNRNAAAMQIKAPEITHKDGTAKVVFYAWHLIGGKVALGFVEGLNNKFRVLQRLAYGYRDEKYLRLKILTCMLPKIEK